MNKAYIHLFVKKKRENMEQIDSNIKEISKSFDKYIKKLFT